MTRDVVANRYAKALFEVGLAEKSLHKLKEELERVVRYAADGQLLFLENPVFSVPEKTGIMESLLDRDKSSSDLKRFVRIIVEAKRAGQIEEIYKEYVNLLDEHEGKEKAVLVSAVRLTEAQAARLAKTLSRIRDKKVIIENVVDESLIGGIRAQVGGFIYDSSVKGFLEKFRERV